MLFSRDDQRPLFVGCAISVLTVLGFLIGGFHTWSARVSDRLFLPRAADPRIVLITIDDASLGHIGRWPWPRRVHADIVSKLAAVQPSVIAYDVNFPEPSDPGDDQQLEEALKRAGNVVLPVELEVNVDRGRLTYNPNRVLSPISALSAAARATGHTNTSPDADGVVRRVPITVTAPDGSSVRSFVTEVLRVAGLERQLQEAPIDVFGTLAINFPNQPARAFRALSAIDVLRGTANLSSLKDALLIVGATAPDMHDALLVPTSYGQPMSGIEIHASALDTVLQRRWLRPVPPLIVVGWILFLGVCLGFCVPKLRARWSVPLAFCLWLVTVIGAFFLFDRGWIVDIVWPTISIFCAYGLITLERRLTAERHRRQLKQALSQYVSASVADAVLKNPTLLKLGGERKRMTVLFSDIRGFTSISERLSPERLVALLNIYLGRMTEIVFAQNGVLDKYIGDAVMAFWNAPLVQPDHARRAVQTALEMRDALAEMNQKKLFGEIELHIGIGINTGEMVVGNVGGAARFDYTVIGDQVNLASRLEGITKEYHVGIVITEACASQLGGTVLTRRLDKVAVKGKKEPVTIYEVLERMSSAIESQKQLAQSFEAALEAYFSKNFQDAIAKCHAILSAHPDDGPSKNLLERSQQFLVAPPPAEWDGTWVFTKK